MIVDTGSTITYVPCASCGRNCGPHHKVTFSPPDPALDAPQPSRALKQMCSQDIRVPAASPDAARPCRMRPLIPRPPARPPGSRAAATSAHAGGRPAAAPTHSCAPTSGRMVGALTLILAPHTLRSCWAASDLCPGNKCAQLQHAAHSWQHAVTARMHSIGLRPEGAEPGLQGGSSCAETQCVSLQRSRAAARGC